ncbi:hypothetical protein FRC06_011428 [Ceratobasidium sp. 370]|nr:hypothetical protein FRC06_011428 [Ceratobasidium sp. 370]
MVVETHSHRVVPASASAAPTQNGSARAPSVAPASNPTTTTATPIIRTRIRSAQSIRRERLRVNQVALSAKLLRARDKFDKEVLELGKEYHKSPNEIRSRVLLKNKFGVKKRWANSYNAFRRMQSKARSLSGVTEAVGDSQTFDEVQNTDMISYRDASRDEIEAAREELEKEKKAKGGYVHKSLKARVQHADKVIRGINCAVQELNYSAGIECICLFVNGSNRDHSVGQAVYTPKGLAFVEGPLRHTVDNLLRDMQTFAQAGTNGIVMNHKQLQKALRNEFSVLVLNSLQAAADVPTGAIQQMKYTNFKRRILKVYSVKLVGWSSSLGEFRNPSNMGNDALTKAIALFKTNTCRFERMSPEECAELDEELANAPTEPESSAS